MIPIETRRASKSLNSAKPGSSLPTNWSWIYRGGSLEDFFNSTAESVPLHPPAPDEVIAKVEAVTICSSDLKIIRMGNSHPLFASAKAGGTVLGHEVCLRVFAVGRDVAARFTPGQRLALQPAMSIDGKRYTIGMDAPGGFAQYLRLDRHALNLAAPYVFDVPDSMLAAHISMLEPYGCVERAYRPNGRQEFFPAGRCVIVAGPDSGSFHSSTPLFWTETVCIGEGVTDILAANSPKRVVSDLSSLANEQFDDILVLGNLPASDIQKLLPMMKVGGLFLLARRTEVDATVQIDPARIHYDALTFLGTDADDIMLAFEPDQQRFDVRAGGAALIHGAGGAMGHIHVHRLLQLTDGPSIIVATSRKSARREELKADFTDLARRNGRSLFVVDTAELSDVVPDVAPHKFDDAIVVAPNPDAVADAVALLADDGVLNIFAGMPYGAGVAFDIGKVATGGQRIIGSTGCSVSDMQNILCRVLKGELDLSVNLNAVAGFRALPEAIKAMMAGEISGKIVIYPHAPDLPLTSIKKPLGIDESWDSRKEQDCLGPA